MDGEWTWIEYKNEWLVGKKYVEMVWSYRAKQWGTIHTTNIWRKSEQVEKEENKKVVIGWNS